VPTNTHDMTHLLSVINNGVHSDNMADVNISTVLIEKCICKLNAGKGDGGAGFQSDHLINGCPRLYVLLSLLFNTMLYHGHTANDLLYATIISIPKDMRASLCSDDNYRGISLCSSICKLFDLVIIDKYKVELSTSNLQFGFKNGHSTVMCTAC
jgi:hypothetical protein